MKTRTRNSLFAWIRLTSRSQASTDNSTIRYVAPMVPMHSVAPMHSVRGTDVAPMGTWHRCADDADADRCAMQERLRITDVPAIIGRGRSTDQSTMWDRSRAVQTCESPGLSEGPPNAAGRNMLTTTIAQGAGPHLVSAPAGSGWLVAFVTTDGRAWCVDPARRSFEG